MKAILLAAGKGDRFFPFSTYRAKPMFPVCNRPLLEWSLRGLVSAGLDDITIVVGHNEGTVRRHFGDGNRFGCRVTYATQSDPRGTAHAALCAADYVGDEDVCIALGDLYVRSDAVRALLDAYRPDAPSGVAAVNTVSDISRHVRASLDGDGRITDCLWKPRGGEGTALVGLYALRNQAFRDLIRAADHPKAQFGIAPSPGREIFDIIPLLAEENRPLCAVSIDGPVHDMDYPWHPHTIARSIARELGDQLSESVIADTASVSPGARIDGPVSIAEGAVIHAGASLEGPVWIGPGTQIFEGSQIAPRTFVGASCRIGPFAKVSGCVGDDCHITYLGEFSGVMLDGGRVTHQIQLSGVFGLGAEIGAGTQVGTLRFDDGPIDVIVQGRRRTAEGFSGVLFGDYSRTGVGALIMPGRIVGPCAMVGAGVVVTNNVPPHKAVLLEQNTRLVDWAPAIYDR